MPSWSRRAGLRWPLRQHSAEWTEEMGFSVYLNHGKEWSQESSYTFTKCSTPGQAVELIRSGLEKLWFENTLFFDRKNTSPKIYPFSGLAASEATSWWRLSFWAQNRPFAFFTFTCFQVGSALNSSLVMSSANWRKCKRCPVSGRVTGCSHQCDITIPHKGPLTSKSSSVR